MDMHRRIEVTERGGAEEIEPAASSELVEESA
jgi:hypothetical protein